MFSKPELFSSGMSISMCSISIRISPTLSFVLLKEVLPKEA